MLCVTADCCFKGVSSPAAAATRSCDIHLVIIISCSQGVFVVFERVGGLVLPGVVYRPRWPVIDVAGRKA